MNRTHIPRNFQSSNEWCKTVVGRIATTARMMCFYVLVVGATSCLDRVVHAFPVVNALPTTSPCVDIFHVDRRHSRDMEQRVRRKRTMNRADLVQLGGHVTNPEDPNTCCQRPWMQTRHVRQDRLTTVSDRARWRAKLEESWNVLTTWRVQSVLTEAPFLCARVVKKGILTKCADTARLVGRSRCCQSSISQRSVQSSIANLFVLHEVCLWSIQFKKTLCTAAILPTSKRRQPFRQKRTMRFASGDKKSLCKRDVQSVGFTPTVANLRIRRSQR